jgi:YD repeat-containing protein
MESTDTAYLFDLRGRLSRITDVHGNRLELDRDPAGRLPLQGTSRFSPNPGSVGTVALDYRLTRVQERNALGALTGRFVTLTYNGATGRLSTLADSTGRSWSYHWP